MAQRPVLHVPVLGGMREDVSTHNAPPGTLTLAENVRFPIPGECESRRGTTALVATSGADVDYSDIISGLGMIGAMPSSFAVGSQGYGFRYDFGKARMHTGGSYANAEPLGVFDTVAREEVAVSFANGNGVPWPLSQVVFGGYVATVHSCGNGQEIVSSGESYEVGPGDNVCILRVFTEGGTEVMSANLSSISAAFLVADGSNAVLVMQGTTTALTARVLTPSASGVTLGGASSIGTLNSATSYWHACTWPGIGWAAIYQTGATTVTINKLSGVTSAATQTFTVTGTVPLSVYCDTTHLYAGWREGSSAPVTANARVYDTTLTLTSGVSAVEIATDAAGLYLGPPLFGPCTTAASAMYVVSRSTTPSISDASWIYWAEMTATGTLSTQVTTYQCGALSAPFGNGYCWVRLGNVKDSFSNRYERAALLDFMGMRTSAAAAATRRQQPVVALTGAALAGAEGSAYTGAWYLQGLGVPSTLSDGTLIMAIPRTVRLETVPSGGLGGLTIGEWLKFSTGGTRQSARFKSAQVVAGFPTLSMSNFGTVNYDGVNTNYQQRDGCDLGCPVPPGMDTPTSSNSSGTLTNGGFYQWRAVAEYIDANGVRWRSAPSVTVSKTLGASDDTAALTARFNPNLLRNGFPGYQNSSRWVMHFYRTVAGGSTFYRCTPPQGAPVNTLPGVYTFTDELSDGSLTAREILYTDGGVLGNDAPPSCRFIATTEDRLWLGGLWETEQLQSSKILVPGEPPQFSDSPAFRVVLPDACTGLAVQDGVVVAFCKSAIYAVQGGGPTDQGQGAWDSPRVITRSTGCINARSILLTSVGIFFQSTRGIELLPRGLGEPQFVGAPVQASLGTANIVSAAVVTTGYSRTARFCLGTSYLLVYDLNTGAWSRDYYPGFTITGITDTDSGAVLALSAVSNTYGFLQESGSVVNDSTGNGPVAVASTLQWAEQRPFGIAGYGRFSAAIGLFDKLTSGSSPGYQAGNATLFLTVDGATDAGKAFDMSVFNQPDYRKYEPLRQEGSAAILKLTTAANGWRFVGWTIEIEEIGGGRRMGETEQG